MDASWVQARRGNKVELAVAHGLLVGVVTVIGPKLLEPGECHVTAFQPVRSDMQHAHRWFKLDFYEAGAKGYLSASQIMMYSRLVSHDPVFSARYLSFMDNRVYHPLQRPLAQARVCLGMGLPCPRAFRFA